jgi:hypothetical protein
MEELIGQLFSTLMDREIREGKLEYIECAREKAEELEYHFENEYPVDSNYLFLKHLLISYSGWNTKDFKITNT